MKRKLAVLLLVALLLTTCMAMFCGCVDEEPEPREVELELVNPITGDEIKYGDTIDLPESQTQIKVRIKEKETGDIVSGICDIYWMYIIDNKAQYPQKTFRYWPTHEQLKDWTEQTNYYEVDLYFDCNKGIKNPNYERKYRITSTQIRFYINGIK